MKKIYFLLLAIMMFATSVFAQPPSLYGFAGSTGTYTAITGGTTLGAAAIGDDVGIGNLPIGFTFTYNSTPFTVFGASSNGFIQLGNTSASIVGFSGNALSTTSNCVSALWDDNNTTGGSIIYNTTGAAPNRVLTVQYTGMHVGGVGSGTNPTISFQILLYETTNVVQVIYGPTSAALSSTSASIGISGASGNFQSLTPTSTTSPYATVSTSTENTLISAATFFPTGTTYTFTPPPPCVAPIDQPTGLVTTPINSSQINGTFTAAPSVPNGYLVVRYLAGGTVTNPVNTTTYATGAALGAGTVVQSGTLTTFSATGLLPSTAYDFYVYSFNNLCSGGPLYLAASPLTGSAITPAQTPPTCATTYTPLNAAINAPITQTLSWSGALGSPAITGYNVYLSTNSALVTSDDISVRVSTNQTGTTYTPVFGALSFGNTYYWKIVPINSIGTSVGCIVNSFSTYTPVNGTSTAIGGLWSSPATWTSGVVPIAGDNVTIADGSIVTIDQIVNGINNLTIGGGTSGILQWNSTSNAMTLFGNLTVNSGGRFLEFTSVGGLVTTNIGGNLNNMGYINAALSTLAFNGSQQAGGSLSQSLLGTGTFQGNGGADGIIRFLTFATTGSSTINTSQNIITGGLVHTAGSLNTNGKLKIDNPAAQLFGLALNTQVANIAVTAMGAGYTAVPVVFGATTSPWIAGGAATAATRYSANGNVYICTVAGAFDGMTPPSHTSGVVTNGAATLLWLAPVGVLGNPYSTTVAFTVGTQYFYGTNLYVCTITGTGNAVNVPIATSGITSAGTASFLYVGTAAQATPNFDAVTGTVRSLNIVNPGAGYSSSPTVTINSNQATAPTATASASALVLQSVTGPTAASTQRSGSATITGGISINSTQSASSQSGVGNISTSNGGVNYTVAPLVGFAGPAAINLITAQGSGYTSTPTVTVTGGTLVSAAATPLTTANFTITVNQGKVVSVYLNTATTILYSVPPTLAITGGAGTGATLAFPAGCWPAATAIIGANGQITNFNMTNAGFGYVAAPTVGVGTTTATTAGGTFTTVATAPTARIALYNLVVNNFTPSPANVPATDDAAIPANRKLNSITLGSTTPVIGNLNLTSGIELFSITPLTLNAGVLNMGGSNLLCSWNGYLGQTGTLATNVTNGSITLTTRGGALIGNTLTYPFDAPLGVFTGTAATVAVGSTIQTITASRTAAPTGAGNPIGTRAYNLVTGGTYGTSPTVTLNYNANDALVSDQQSLFVSQAAAVTGAWTTRSLTSGTGVLAATGSRTTATTGVGPIVPTGNDFYAWSSTYIPTPLNYRISRATNQTYNSIIATGTDIFTTGTSTDDNTASVVLTGIAGGAPTFMYQGQPITGFSLSTNGWVKLNTAASPSTTLTSFGNTLNLIPNVIAPFWDDLTTNPNGNTLALLQAAMKYKVIGTTAGSRQIVMEWKNMTVFGAAGPQLNFQVVLDEMDNSIKINYGLFQGFNGTNDHRYSYSTGLSGTIVNSNPLPGQVLAQQYENSNAFSNEYVNVASVGSNGLLSMPECNSTLTFAAGAPGAFMIPANTPPVNDESAGAITVTALSAFPANLCGNFYTSRNATASANAVCAGNNDDDVWFKFTANEPVTTVRVYGAGGYVARVQVLDAALSPLSPAQCVVAAAQGTSVDALLNGLTVGSVYFVRVYHDGGGVQATATATINGAGQVNLITLINGGSGYNTTLTATGSNGTARVRFTGGGGKDAVGQVTVTSGVVSSFTLTSGGYGYTSAPTVTIEKPNWAQNGEFALVVYAPPANDDCFGAKPLTNLTNTDCTTGQNSVTSNTGSATPSPEVAVCGNADDDLWYKFTAVSTLTHVQAIGTGSFDAAFEVFNGGVMPGACVGKTSVICRNVNGVGAMDSVTVTTVIGNTYFVRMYHAGVGSVAGETFTLCVRNVVTTLPCATNTTPANMATGVATLPNTTFTWGAVTGATNYTVFYGITNPPTTSVNTTTNTVNVTGLLSSTLYYWYVVPKFLLNTSATGCDMSNVTSFTTAAICDAPTTPAVPSVTIMSTSANVTFTALGTGMAYIVEYGPAGFTPGMGASAGTSGTVVTGTGSPITITGLTQNTTYDVYVRQNCTASSLGFSPNTTVVTFTTPFTPPANDNCANATTLTHSNDPDVCTTVSGTTVNATQSTELSGCFSSSSDDDVWYTFTATSTNLLVKLTNIVSVVGTVTGLDLGLHSACGVTDGGLCSFLTQTGGNENWLVTNLVVGNVYKLRVLTDGASSRATFDICLTVPSITPGTNNTCATGTGVTIGATNNNQWLALFNTDGNLIAEINANGNNLGLVTPSVYTTNNGTLRTGLVGGAYMNRNIAITVATQPTTPVSVRLYYTLAEKAALDAAAPGTNNGTDIVITKEPGGCTAVSALAGGQLLPQTYSTYGASNAYSEISVSSFSEFFLHKGASALPITIEYLNGTKQTNGNILDWKITCNSAPDVVIELQRSADSRSFRAIDVQSSTAVRCQQAFVYNDVSPAAGINYYRLKVTEPNGSFRYSNIIALINKDKGYEIVSLAPNPVRTNAILTVATAKADKINIVITDIVGQVMAKQAKALVPGNNTIAMNFDSFAAGTYTITITNADGEVKTTRFVKY